MSPPTTACCWSVASTFSGAPKSWPAAWGVSGSSWSLKGTSSAQWRRWSAGFAASTEPELLLPLIAGKLGGALSGAALALWVDRRQEVYPHSSNTG